MSCCVMQCLFKLSSCEILPDGIVRCSRTALNAIKCHADDEQRAQAAADPQSPTQSMLLSADAQAEQQLQSNGNMSPQQQLEVQEQHLEADMQSIRKHMFCFTDLAKVDIHLIRMVSTGFLHQHMPASTSMWHLFCSVGLPYEIRCRSKCRFWMVLCAARRRIRLAPSSLVRAASGPCYS